MPIPQAAKTGPDYSRTKAYLNQSKIQTSNNALFQSINGLIEGAKTFQGFIQAQYNSLSGSLTSLYDTVSQIVVELTTVRNAFRFGASFSGNQTVADGGVDEPLEFDTVIFDTGLMYGPDPSHGLSNSEFVMPSNGQYQIQAGINCGPASDTVYLSVYINGVQVVLYGPVAMIAVLLPVLKNDVIQININQDSGGPLAVNSFLQIFRVSYTGGMDV